MYLPSSRPLPGRRLGQHAVANRSKMPIEVCRTVERAISAGFNVRNANPRSLAQGLEIRLGLLLLVFDEAQPVTHHLAGVLIAALSYEPLDEISLMFCKNDVAGRHGHR